MHVQLRRAHRLLAAVCTANECGHADKFAQLEEGGKGEICTATNSSEKRAETRYAYIEMRWLVGFMLTLYNLLGEHTVDNRIASYYTKL